MVRDLRRHSVPAPGGGEGIARGLTARSVGLSTIPRACISANIPANISLGLDSPVGRECVGLDHDRSSALRRPVERRHQ